MAPLPAPWNPVAPIQNNWDKIAPIQKGYLEVIGGIGTIFAAVAAIAMIVDHDGKLPKWPFTKERWNPEQTVDGNKKAEVSEDEIIEDELAEIVGTLGKRSLYEDELEWFDQDLFEEQPKFFKRDGSYFFTYLTYRQTPLLRKFILMVMMLLTLSNMGLIPLRKRSRISSMLALKLRLISLRRSRE